MTYEAIDRQLRESTVPVILDGALGTELRRRGAPGVDDPDIWSVRGLIESPDVLWHIYRDYGLAGADVITAGAFRTNRRALRKANLSFLARPLTHFALALAQEAVRELYEDTGREICVAGNLTSLEDCYTPALSPGEEAEGEHREKVRHLVEAGADLVLIESMPHLGEAAAAVRASRSVANEMPVWLGVVLDPDGGKMLDGTDVESILPALKRLSAMPDALLFNCSHRDAVTKAVSNMVAGAPIPIGAYANAEEPPPDGGDPWHRVSHLTPDRYADMALAWARAGARIIGGCCGTTPDDIRRIRRRVREEYA